MIVSTAAYKNTERIDAESGGTIELGDGTELYFPPGALKQDCDIAVTILSASKIPDGEAEMNNSWRTTDKAWSFEIEPYAEFNSLVTLKFSYSDSDVTGLNQELLRVYWFDEEKEIWRMVDTSVAFPGSNQVFAYVPHFTVFRIAQYVAPEYIISKDSAYVYPNPVSGSEATFKFRLMRAAEVELKVFNVAGELIKEFSQSYVTEDAGKTQEIKWDIEGIASGVYVWYLKARSDGREDTVIKKLGIVK